MSFFHASDGARLYYTDTGSDTGNGTGDSTGAGLPVLCLSGLTRNGADFDYLAPQLAGHRMITLDYRGRGQSDFTGAQTYNFARESQDILELLDHLDLSGTAIVGTSRGGVHAAMLALVAPERVRGTCLVDVGPVLEAGGLAGITDYLGRAPDWRTLDEAAEGLKAALPAFANVARSRWRQEAAHRFIETVDGLALRYDPALREAVLANIKQGSPDLWPMFEALGNGPTILLRGANSDLLSARTALDMELRIKGLECHEIPDRGHVPFLDEPTSQKAIKAWLEDLK